MKNIEFGPSHNPQKPTGFEVTQPVLVSPPEVENPNPSFYEVTQALPKLETTNTVIDGIDGTNKQKLLAQALLNFAGGGENINLGDYCSESTKTHFKKYLPIITDTEEIPPELVVKEYATNWEPELIQALQELGIDTSLVEAGDNTSHLIIKTRVPTDLNSKVGRVDEFIFTPAQATRLIQNLLGLDRSTVEDQDQERSEENSMGKVEDIYNDEIAIKEQTFESSFNISEAELESIPGYNSLSLGQKKLLLENFTQLTFGTVEEEAARLYGETKSVSDNKYHNKYVAGLKKSLLAFKEVFTKDLAVLKLEQQVASEMRTGGLSKHREIITQLVASLVDHGPKVFLDKANGGIKIDLVNFREGPQPKKDLEWEAKMAQVNETAHAFARTPAAWRGKTLGVDGEADTLWGGATKWLKSKFSQKRKNQLTYEVAENKYRLARRDLEALCREEGKTDAEIATILNGLDIRVYQLQILQTAPETVATLAEIEDKNIYKEAAKKLFTNGALGYMTLGFVARTTLGSLPGFVGAPLAASGIAWWRSKSDTASALRERDKNARMGVVETDQEYQRLLQEMKAAYAKDPTSAEYKSSVERLSEYKGNGELNIISAQEVAKKTQRLIDSVLDLDEKLRYADEQSDDEAVSYWSIKKDKALESLAARVNYIKDKQQLQRVSFGSRNEQVANQTILYQTLGEGLTLLSLNEHIQVDGRFQVDGRLQNKLESKLTSAEKNIVTMRKAMRNHELKKSVIKAASFSFVGALFGELYDRSTSAETVEVAAGPAVVGVVESDLTVTPETKLPAPEGILPTEVSVDSETTAITTAQTAEPAGEVAEAVSLSVESYIVKPGDTLSEIVADNLPQQKNVVRSLLSLTPEEVRSIGLRSGDIDLIYPKETINLTLLEKILANKR